MGRSIDYSPEQVTRALMELVAHGGNCARAAEELIDDEFQVPVATLRRWKTDTHAEQYRRLEEAHGRQLEQQVVEVTRANVVKAAELESDLIEKMAGVPPEQQPQALRALADVKAKGIDKILALTGRAQPAPRAHEFGQLLDVLAARGLVKMNVPVPEPAVEGSAEELPP